MSKFPDKLIFLSMLHYTWMYGVCIMNLDTGNVFYMFPLKFLSICMVNVTVTFLSRLVFPRKLKCYCALLIARIFLKLKRKEKKRKHFHQWLPFRAPTEDIRMLLWCIVLMSTELCVFTLVWCQNNAVHLPEPTHWNKRLIQRETFGWSQFLGVFMHGHPSW